jgi:anti-sigma-K factor RskA
LKRSESLRALVREYQNASTAIPYALDPVAPSSGLKDRVIAAATGQKTAVRPAMLSRVFWSAAAVILFSILVGTLFSTPDYKFEFAMTGPKEVAPAAAGKVVWVDRHVKLEIVGLPALPAGKVYQLWQIGPEKAPIRARTFTLDPNGGLEGEDRMKYLLAKGQTFALTVEPAGGSNSPTLPIFCVGKVE